jgi:hypothetical protein
MNLEEIARESCAVNSRGCETAILKRADSLINVVWGITHPVVTVDQNLRIPVQQLGLTLELFNSTNRAIDGD